MAPLQYSSSRNKLLFFLSFCACILLYPSTQAQSLTYDFKSTTRLLLSDAKSKDLTLTSKIKPTSISNNQSIRSTSNTDQNQTKLIKTTSNPPKNQTKFIIPTSSSPKNQTKSTKFKWNSPKNQTKPIKINLELANSVKNKTKLAKPSTKVTLTAINTQLKRLNSTKPTSNLITKVSEHTKSSPTKNNSPKTETKLKNTDKSQPQKPNIVYQDEEEEDLVTEFRDLTSRFQQTLLPDLEKISLTSKDYLTRYNKQMTKGFRPYVGTKYATTIASFVSFAFIIIPLILVSLLVNRIKSYFSLQKVLIFIQVYLCIYFYILCLSSLVTGLEPLRYFYAASRSTYICVQVLQTLGYVLYLLMLLMYLVLVFSSETGPSSKIMGLAQTFVGFAVGLHYYVTVFHRVVLRQPPKTSWRVHGIYASCYLVICMLATADRRKKAYLEDGGEEGKNN